MYNCGQNTAPPFCNNKQIMNIKSMFDPQTKVTCVVVQWFFYSMYVAVMKMKCVGSNMKFLRILSEFYFRIVSSHTVCLSIGSRS